MEKILGSYAMFEEEGKYVGMQLDTVDTLVLLFNRLSLTDSNITRAATTQISVI